MKVRILGARGSHPVSNQSSTYYGGSTSCVQVSSADETIIMDAGTGIVNFERDLPGRATKIHHILLTHLHMDHIQGLGFFDPLFDTRMDVHIWGPGGIGESLSERLKRFLSPPLFPVTMRDIPSKLHIHELTGSTFDVGCFRITNAFVSHPGPTLGYRINDGKRSMAYLPDHEPVLGKPALPEDNDWLSGFDLADGCDLLIHDAQYSMDEYQNKIGWGHSSMDHAAEFAARTQVGRLIMFHHDPAHTDTILRGLYDQLMSQNTFPFPVELAKEGEQIIL